jgi:hypothetical protein
MKLFEIGEQFDALERLLVESGGEVTPEVEAWLAEYGDLEADKLDGYAMFIRSLEHEAEGFKNIASEFAAKRTARENAAKRLKERLKQYMELRGTAQIKGKMYTAALNKNGGKAPIIVDVAPEQLPEQLQRVTVSADVEKIRGLLEMGVKYDFAHLGEVGQHVKIR